MSADPNTDPRFNVGGNVSKLISRPNGMWEPDDHSKVRMHIFPSSGYVQPPGACDMSFSDALARGYAGSKGDWGSFEATIYYLVTDVDDDQDHLHFGGPTGEHPGNSSPCCMGFSYKSFVSVDDPVHVFFGKEMYHVTNDDLAPKILRTEFGANYDLSVMDLINRPDVNIFAGKFGVKYMVFLNQGPEKKNVRLEQWLNISGDKQTWVKVNERTDSGGWGSGGTTCDGDDDQIGNWKAGRVRIRWDQGSNTHIQIGMASVRSLEDGGGTGGGGFPIPTSGTEFIRIIDVRYHLGVLPLGTCGASVANPFTEFYNVEATDKESNLHRDRYRVGVLARFAASKVIGKKPRRVTMRLSVNGTPPDEPIECNLRKATDDTVAVHFDLIDIDGVPTTGDLTAGLLTEGVIRNCTFENVDHNYSWTLNDILNCEYSGNTVDVLNEVNVHRNESGPYDGGNTCLIRYDRLDVDGKPVGYSDPDPEKDLSWILYE